MKEDLIEWQDLAPSNYHLFGHMKEVLRNNPYSSDEEVKTAVMKRTKEQTTEFLEAWIHAPIQKCNVAIERNSDYVEK